MKAPLLDDCTILPLRRFCPMLVLDDSTERDKSTGCSYSDLVYFSVSVDTSNTKDLLEVRDVRLSVHKGAHLSDTDSYTDIGLSSEEEADKLDPAPQFRRKYARPAHVPDPDPVTPVNLPSTSDEATVRIPKEAPQQVHDLLGQLLQGQVPSTGGTGGTDGGSSSQKPPGSNPFNVRRAKEGERCAKFVKEPSEILTL